MSEYINEDIFEDEEFKYMQAVADEVSKWPEWKRNICAIDSYYKTMMEAKNNKEDNPG